MSPILSQSLATISLSISLGFASLPAMAARKSFTYQAVIKAELLAKYSDRYLGGKLFFDGRKRLVQLELQPKMPACAEGRSCAQVMPEPISYELRHAKSTLDSCGIIQTVAQVDQRPVDGIFLKVTIRNNMNNTCPTLVALPALDVNLEQKYYNRLEGREVSTFDSFIAKDVALIKPAAL